MATGHVRAGSRTLTRPFALQASTPRIGRKMTRHVRNILLHTMCYIGAYDDAVQQALTAAASWRRHGDSRMKPRMKQVLGIATLGIALTSLVPAAHAQTTASAHGDILVQKDSSWNGKKYEAYPKGTPELTVLKLSIPAHTALPWHIHPFPNAGYVLSGQLTIEDQASGKKQTFKTGQAFTESVNDVHRGISGDVPTVLIITYSGSPGVATFKQVGGGKPEY
jgi:quercetin dioxygenase-like cupin family protein